MAKHNEIGKIGENIAVKYLKNNGFLIIGRNFLCKMGEIDIVAKKNIPLHMKDPVLQSKKLQNSEIVSCETNNFKENGKKNQIIQAQNTVTHEKLYFIEVKTKSVELFSDVKCLKNDIFAPENNFNYKKKQRMFRAIKYYLFKNNLNLDVNCEISLLIVYLNEKLKQGKVKFYETVILS